MANDPNTQDGFVVENGAIVLRDGGGRAAASIPLIGITATRVQRSYKWPADAWASIAIGIISLAVIPLVPEVNPMSSIVLTLVLVALGLFIGLRTKPLYKLIVTSGGNETIAITDTDRARIEAAGADLERLRTTPQ